MRHCAGCQPSAALTMVLLTLLATVAILQFAFLERRTHYQ